MFKLFCSLIRFLLLFTFKKRRSLILIIFSLKKENDILKRHLKVSERAIKTKKSERFILSVLCSISGRVENHLCIVKPETLLKWQRVFIKKQWTFKRNKPGRPALTKQFKQLILQMKKDNFLWGSRRISGELKKLGIDIHYTTVYRVIQTFRKNGFIKPSGCWEKFLKSHWESLFATDLFTIDSLFGKRLYIFFIIQLKSRRLMQWRIT